MNRWTAFFLVLLRVAIGWHFLVEGLEKVSMKNWTAAPYLREASGPLAPYFHQLAGDPILDKLPFPPAPTGDAPPAPLPPPLAQEWTDYLDAFIAHYHLDEGQQDAARKKFAEAEKNTTKWFNEDKKVVSIPSPWGPPAEVSRTLRQRVEAYAAKLRDARELESRELLLFGKGAEEVVKAAKTEARQAGAELRKDLDDQTRAMKEGLQSVLTADQKKLPPLPDTVRPPLWHWSTLQWSDLAVSYGLVVIGAGLILGLFSRTSSFLGAVLLLLFFLAMPPFPGTPDNPKAEGHYLFINKNIIEMLALLALSTTASGRWVGLDGLVHVLNPFRRRAVRPAPHPLVAPAPAQPAPPEVAPSDRVQTETSPLDAVSPSVAPTEERPHGA